MARQKCQKDQYSILFRYPKGTTGNYLEAQIKIINLKCMKQECMKQEKSTIQSKKRLNIQLFGASEIHWPGSSQIWNIVFYLSSSETHHYYGITK